jgi:hypothetical protein
MDFHDFPPHLYGYKLVEASSLVIDSTIPKRHHKKKRIHKKWIKKYGYRMIPNPNIFIMGDTILAHPVIIGKIKNQLRRIYVS